MIKIIILSTFLLGACLPLTIISGAAGLGDSYLKEKKIEKLNKKIDKLEETREKRQIDNMIQTKEN
tara:strand:+ start:180 stop:377 length:198 start_codon:yes stop_codon:yes gene_type:complete